MKVLQVEHIDKSRKRKKILCDLSFEVGAQEIVGLLGPNGSGKSTTIKCICGLYRLDSGSVRICGNDIRKNRTEALKNLGIAMEVPALYPELTGMENLKMMAAAKGITSGRMKKMADFTGLEDRIYNRTGTYSMGMKMRLSLALAIMDNPKLVILDEPTNGLDPEAVFHLRNEIEQIRQAGSAVLVSSHQLGELEKIADRVVAIEKGTVRFDGGIAEISGRYESLEEFYKSLYGAERK
jgi:ABC-2 type transport system ATP-binding protein